MPLLYGPVDQSLSICHRATCMGLAGNISKVVSETPTYITGVQEGIPSPLLLAGERSFGLPSLSLFLRIQHLLIGPNTAPAAAAGLSATAAQTTLCVHTPANQLREATRKLNHLEFRSKHNFGDLLGKKSTCRQTIWTQLGSLFYYLGR